ncbi:MAG TPA: hypothetical protein VM433_01240 [Mycobacteriales bacterium]|nr:hypothetical protein [Mycobacteriales bacterium]
MSRTRTALAVAVLATGVVGVPAALAAPACDKPGAAVIHEVHEQAEALGEAGEFASDRAHQLEERYCEV